MGYAVDKPFSDLVGKTPISVTRGTYGRNAAILMQMSDFSVYAIGHRQECCEDFTLDDVVGDLEDLVGSPILVSEMPSSKDVPPTKKGEYADYSPSHYTWTFVKLATVKGYVDLRFFGSSNGYYSEDAELFLLSPEGAR